MFDNSVKRLALDTNNGLVALIAYLTDKGIIDDNELMKYLDEVKKKEEIVAFAKIINTEKESIEQSLEKTKNLIDLFNLKDSESNNKENNHE